MAGVGHDRGSKLVMIDLETKESVMGGDNVENVSSNPGMMGEGMFGDGDGCENHRQSSLTIVQEALKVKRRQIIALERLELMLSKSGVEVGSPLEEFMWELLTNSRRLLR